MSQPTTMGANPSMGATREKYHHGDLRAALLDAAVEVIDEIGPQGLTIREVARRVGVSHAAPYRHFNDRDDLILTAVEHGFELLLATMEAAKAAAAQDPVSQFAASGLAYLDFALGNPAYYRVMFSGDLLSPGGNLSLRHTSREALDDLMASIGECQQLGLVREGDPAAHALTILSTLHGFVSLVNDNRVQHLVDEQHSIEGLRDAVLENLFAGIGPR